MTETSYFSLDKITALTTNVREKSEHINSLNISDLSHHAVENDICSRPTNTSTVTDMSPELGLNNQITLHCSVGNRLVGV